MIEVVFRIRLKGRDLVESALAQMSDVLLAAIVPIPVEICISVGGRFVIMVLFHNLSNELG